MHTLLLICATLAMVLPYAYSDNICEVTGGQMTSFDGEKRDISYACKFHAVRGTTCGKYHINLTPALKLVNKKGTKKMYVVDAMWIGVKNLKNAYALGGKMSTNTTQLFFGGVVDNPYVKKDGYLDFKDVYTLSSNCTDKTVTLQERGGAFSIKFRLYDGRNQHSSMVSFECHHDDFKSGSFEKQLCGADSDKVNSLRVLHSIINNTGVVQKHPKCRSSHRILTRRCKITRLQAVRLCKDIVHKRVYRKCLDDPMHTFRECIKFTCSNFADPNSCYDLKTHFADSKCPKLPEVSPKVNSLCGNL